MYRLVIFLDDREAKALKTMAKQEYRNVCSQATPVLREDLVHWKLFHLDDKGGESQEPDNRFESKRIQSIYMGKRKRENNVSKRYKRVLGQS